VHFDLVVGPGLARVVHPDKFHKNAFLLAFRSPDFAAQGTLLADGINFERAGHKGLELAAGAPTQAGFADQVILGRVGIALRLGVDPLRQSLSSKDY
jgi:hypothetical protein